MQRRAVSNRHIILGGVFSLFKRQRSFLCEYTKYRPFGFFFGSANFHLYVGLMSDKQLSVYLYRWVTIISGRFVVFIV